MCAKIGSRVWAVALLKNIKNLKKNKKSQDPYLLLPRGISTVIGPEPTLSGLVTSLTLSPTPNLKSIDIKLWLWQRVKVLCFCTTTADAINTAKPCRATCDRFAVATNTRSWTLLVIEIDWLSGPKYYATVDPIWGSIGPTGQKLWVKMTFVKLNYFKICGPEVGVVDPRERPGWPPRPSPQIWTRYDKPFRSYWIYSNWFFGEKLGISLPLSPPIVVFSNRKNATAQAKPNGTL